MYFDNNACRKVDLRKSHFGKNARLQANVLKHVNKVTRMFIYICMCVYLYAYNILNASERLQA